MLKQFSTAKKLSSQLGPKMAVFREYKNLNIEYSHGDPPKGTSLPKRRFFDVLTYFA